VQRKSQSIIFPPIYRRAAPIMAMRPGTMGAAALRAPLVLGTLVSGGVSDSVGVGVEDDVWVSLVEVAVVVSALEEDSVLVDSAEVVDDSVEVNSVELDSVELDSVELDSVVSLDEVEVEEAVVLVIDTVVLAEELGAVVPETGNMAE
jgi:hypothetical protein